MAIPPTIPTSFVPKQPVTTSTRQRTSGTNPFLALAYLVTGIVVFGCFAVFGYQLYLENVAKAKAAEVVAAQNAIDQATVTEFIRLRDRFTEGQIILNNHITLSQFFDALEKLTLTGVRFSGFRIVVADDRTATIDMSGSARTFNTLAAQSAEFANEKRIKRAIFSGITGNPKDGSVSFSLTAELDSSLVVANPNVTLPATTPVVETPPTAVPTETATGTTATTTP